MIITIDGPAASGKSTVSKVLAKELNIYYLYTGLLYRAVAYILIERLKKKDLSEGVEPDELGFIRDLFYDYGAGEDGHRPYVFFGKEDITGYLHDSSLEQPTSIVSANKHVREVLLGVQREVAERYDIVADGRDCGSVVFPNAEHKFYLTAGLQVRAERMMLDESRGALEKELEKVKASLEERDRRDKERAVAPLTIPEGAVIIDNSNLSLSQTVNKFLRHL